MMFEFEELPKEDTIAGLCNEIQGAYTADGFVKVKPTNCILPKLFKDHVQEIRDFKVRDDDVYLVSNPKCGMLNFIFLFS